MAAGPVGRETVVFLTLGSNTLLSLRSVFCAGSLMGLIGGGVADAISIMNIHTVP